MAYLQCGQCDGGETMLMPSGIRWMHTFKKLPMTHPKVKNTTDQKWNGTSTQGEVDKIASAPIDIFFQGLAHHGHRGGLSGPDFKGFCPLVQQHPQTIGGLATGGLGQLQERGGRGTV